MTPPTPPATSRSTDAMFDSWTGTTIVCAANRATLHEASFASVEHGAVVVGAAVVFAAVVEVVAVELVTAGATGCVEPEQAANVTVIDSAASASAGCRREVASSLTKPSVSRSAAS